MDRENAPFLYTPSCASTIITAITEKMTMENFCKYTEDFWKFRALQNKAGKAGNDNIILYRCHFARFFHKRHFPEIFGNFDREYFCIVPVEKKMTLT